MSNYYEELRYSLRHLDSNAEAACNTANQVLKFNAVIVNPGREDLVGYCDCHERWVSEFGCADCRADVPCK